MNKIAIYGKGGAGKSTLSSALSVTWARQGQKVLHVGCDPKTDSTLTLTDGARPTTLLDLLAQGRVRPDASEFVTRGRYGIDCVEAGGPMPGSGCGGRGIARMFELFHEIRFMETNEYDIAVFDVLGDVVCGGFAAPLRMGFADRALIVVSQEPLSLFAANNIIYAIEKYAANGVRLAGLVVNSSDAEDTMGRVEAFSRAVGVPIAGIIPRDVDIQDAESNYRTAAELSAASPTVAAIAGIARFAQLSFGQELAVPRPLSRDALFDLLHVARRGSTVRPEQRVTLTGDLATEAGVGTGDLAVVSKPGGGSTELPGGRVPPPDRDVRGGGASLEALARVFGLASSTVAGLALEVHSVVYRRQRLEITVWSPKTAGIEVHLSSVQGMEKPFAVAGDIAVAHASRLTKASKPVFEYMVSVLKRRPVEWARLVRFVLDDPSSDLESTAEGTVDQIQELVRSNRKHWNDWGSKGVAGRFIFENERKRQVVTHIGASNDVIRVHHGPQSCQTSEQPATRFTTPFIRFPWNPAEAAPRPDSHDSNLFTSMSDAHLITGTDTRLADLLDAVADAGLIDRVHVDVSCIPVVTGDDWMGTVERLKGRGIGVSLAWVNGDDRSIPLARMALAEAAKIPRPSRVPQSVVLVGFPKTRATDELAKILEAAGVTVLGRYLPDVDQNNLGPVMAADLLLVWPQTEYATVVEQLFARLGKVHKVVPPFGEQGLRAFVRDVTGALGLDDRTDTVLEPLFGRYRSMLERLRGVAGAMRLGVAVLPGQSGVLSVADELCGVPLVQFLGDMGFRVEVFPDASDQARLNWWLSSGIDAVFTDLAVDHRLLSLGVGQFGLADLEAGVAGEVRTLERLIRAGRNPLVRFRRTGGGGNV